MRTQADQAMAVSGVLPPSGHLRGFPPDGVVPDERLGHLEGVAMGGGVAAVETVVLASQPRSPRLGRGGL